MGQKKKLRTMQTTVNAVVAYELSQWNEKKQAKKFDELLRCGFIKVGDGIE